MMRHGVFASLLILSGGWLWAATPSEWAAAYVEQNQQFIAMQAGAPLGFKAGLTSAAARQRFASDRSVYGSFAPGSLLRSGARVSRGEFSRGMVEIELAFQLRRTIAEPIADVAALRSELAKVAVAMELPDLGQLPAGADALQIVRGNVAARYFLVGDGVVVAGRDIDQLSMRLFYRGDLLSEGRSGEVEGGQWAALLALINQRLAMGWRVSPDQWLLTGAIGAMQPLSGGEYRAEVSGLPVALLQVSD